VVGLAQLPVRVRAHARVVQSQQVLEAVPVEPLPSRQSF
jgi:hypothetical protein